MGRLQIERLGGLAGFGGSRLRSRGEIAISALSPADRQAVEALFADKGTTAPRGAADMFRYRITRETPNGPETIEVPEQAVPAALRESVRDVLE